MPGVILIAPCKASDLERILEIERASFGPYAYDRKLFAEYLDDASSSGGLFLIARRKGRIDGYAIVSMGRGQRSHAAELVSIAVDPRARGRGVASRLMASVLRRVRRREFGRLALTVRAGNRAAQSLYENCGFRKERRAPGYYEDGEDGWRMALRL